MLRMKFWSFPMVRLCPFLLSGIASYRYIAISQFCLILILGIGILFLFMLNGFLKQRLATFYGPDLLIFIFFTIIGYLVACLHDPLNQQNHYTNFVTESQSYHTFEAQIDESLKANSFNNRYLLKLNSLNGRECHGKLLINIRKDSLDTKLTANELIIFTAELQPIQGPKNPHQFNYASFMRNRNVFHNIYLEHDQLTINGTHRSFLSRIKDTRDRIIENLEGYKLDSEVKAVIMALLLGQRQEISNELYERYAQSGVVHILAISGLHIGIILIALQSLLKPLNMLRHGPKIRLVLILLILWLFALFTGLSPSVCRAVTMFSLFSIGMNLERPTNSFNTLALSMFILLLFNPNFLFEIGFQLSYLAVLSILLFNPVLSSLWRPKFRMIRYPWQILCVSLAAQIGVLPLSLYYFHQFPGLFFLTNLVLIPFLGLILSLGLLLIGLASFDLLNEWLMEPYGKIIALMNDFVNWVSGFEAWIIKDIPFNLQLVVLSYLIIISAYALISKPSPKFIIICLLAFILFRSEHFLRHKDKALNALVIFHKSRESLVAVKENKRLTVLSETYDLEKYRSILADFNLGERIKSMEADSLRSFYATSAGNLLIIDSVPIYNLRTSAADWILLRNSPRINLDRLIDSLKPGLIICDGSNYRAYRERWKRSCLDKKIPFHSTDEKGAFMVRF